MRRQVVLRATLVVIVVLLLALFIPPFINVNRYRTLVAESISRAVGRQVTVDSIELRMVPQPGFDLTGVVIADDPSFSDEPILRADEMTAYLRLTSLWRGRFEIARLNLKYPSLNLVRRSDGHWNVESLLWRAARTQAAPTTARRPEARVRFPYVEVTSGRVNFKSGLEKSVFAMIDADFALWSPSENQWRTRLDARPVRTDLQISDTGTIKAEATFNRAEMLRDTPLRGKLVWQRAQLGQFTKLLYGRDRGWRGGIDFSTEFTGTPAELHFTSSLNLDDFRRYDIIAGEQLSVGISCSGVADASDEALNGVTCQMPAGKGTLKAAGTIGRGLQNYDVDFLADKVPASFATAIARHAKRNLPTDLTASGTVDLDAHFSGTPSGTQSANPPRWTGKGAATDVTLTSGVLSTPLKLGDLSFAIGAPAVVPQPVNGKRSRKAKSAPKPSPQPPAAPASLIRIAEFNVDAGAESPLALSASATAQSYEFKADGPAKMERLIEIGRTVGVSVPRIGVKGDANVQMSVDGKWAGLPEPAVNGSATVAKAHAEIPGIASPVEIASARVQFSDRVLTLSSLDADAGKLHFTGTAALPRHCDDVESCAPKFELAFDDLDLAELNSMVNPHLKRRPWYRLFGSGEEKSVLATLSATGRLSAKRAVAGKLSVAHLSADFALDKGLLDVTSLSGELFKGTHQGHWRADFRQNQPVYSGSGTIHKAQMRDVGVFAKQPFGSGTLDGSYDANLAGNGGDDLLQTLVLNAMFTWRDGALNTISVDGKPLRFSAFDGAAKWKDGKLQLSDASMKFPSGSYSVTGSVTGGFGLELQLAADHGPSYSVRGTLERPQVVTANATQKGVEPQGTPQASLKR